MLQLALTGRHPCCKLCCELGTVLSLPGITSERVHLCMSVAVSEPLSPSGPLLLQVQALNLVTFCWYPRVAVSHMRVIILDCGNWVPHPWLQRLQGSVDLKPLAFVCLIWGSVWYYGTLTIIGIVCMLVHVSCAYLVHCLGLGLFVKWVLSWGIDLTDMIWYDRTTLIRDEWMRQPSCSTSFCLSIFLS